MEPVDATLPSAATSSKGVEAEEHVSTPVVQDIEKQDKDDTDDSSSQKMPNERVILTTRRLMLRPAFKDDAPSLFECFSDPLVMKYWDTLPHTTLDQTAEWLDRMVDSPTNGVSNFVICRTSDDMPNYTAEPSSPVIGKVGVWDLDRNEIGFMIAKKYWRQGILSEALTILLPYLFDARKLPDLTADVDPRNRGSRALLEKFGFALVGSRERTFCVGGEWVDSVDYRLTRAAFEAWRAAQKSPPLELRLPSRAKPGPAAGAAAAAAADLQPGGAAPK